MTAAIDSRAVAFVTGATGMVGSAIVSRLVANSCVVVALGRDSAKLDELHARHQAGAVCSVRCDLAERGNVAAVARSLPERVAGRRVIVVNSAGIHGPLAPVQFTDPVVWRHVLEVNLLAAIEITGALLPAMLAVRWGRIVNISSKAGLSMTAFNGPYATSKAALNRWTGQLALELAGTGVTAHALHPGEIRSAMWQGISAQASTDARYLSFAKWAHDTGQSGDDPTAAADLVARLLDDTFAAQSHGRLLLPVGDETTPVDLTR